MYHTVIFSKNLNVDLEIAPKQPLERVLIQKGARRRAQIRPYVMETEAGPVEVADLFFQDGSATRMVPFRYFSFAD